MKKLMSFRISPTASAALEILQRSFPDATATELVEASLQYAAYSGGLGASPQICKPEQQPDGERIA